MWNKVISKRINCRTNFQRRSFLSVIILIYNSPVRQWDDIWYLMFCGWSVEKLKRPMKMTDFKMASVYWVNWCDDELAFTQVLIFQFFDLYFAAIESKKNMCNHFKWLCDRQIFNYLNKLRQWDFWFASILLIRVL